MLIQIYEIQEPQEALQMLRLGVDHIGTVLMEPRHAENKTIRETIHVVQREGGVSSVIPLFSDEREICGAVERLGFDILHLCDTLLDVRGTSIDPEPLIALQRRIRKRYPKLRIARSIPVPVVGDERIASEIGQLSSSFAAVSDLLLIDTWLHSEKCDQPVQGFVGITGVICDWVLARRIVQSVDIPVILAGGLGPDNVEDAIITVKPAGVDSCTRTNACDASGKPIRFRKDVSKVSALVKGVRQAEIRLGE
jgi:phosphoribosylanthranilate isomerase